jgi:hypothetical protein
MDKSLFVINGLEDKISYRGVKYFPITMPMAPCTYFGWILKEDAAKSNDAPGVLEFRWSGFQVVDTNPDVAEMIAGRIDGKFAVAGAGIFVISDTLLQGDLTQELNDESKIWFSTLLKDLFYDECQFDKPLLIGWIAPDEPQKNKDYTVVHVTVSTPCTEEEYRCYVHLHTQELLATKLSAVGKGISFETSEGRTLQ